MASREQIAIRQQLALETIRDTLAKHDAESATRLRNAAADGTIDAESVPPHSNPELVTAFLAESVASLALLVDRQHQPRRRGRPPKHKSD